MRGARAAPRRGARKRGVVGGSVRQGLGFGAGPIWVRDDDGVAGEQPLPSASAVASVAYVGSANIDVITQFWLARAFGCSLFRFRYSHPPASAEMTDGRKVELVASAMVAGRPGGVATGGGPPKVRTAAFSCSSKRTASANGMRPLVA